jgi:hypothetical protein
MATLPAFYTRIASPRYGTFAIDVYHEHSECQRGQRTLGDRTEVFGTGGRRLCTECRRFGREREVKMRRSWRDALSVEWTVSSP